ncbi:TPA: hypothetical protein ACIWQZ_004582, partial [Salmonella enterica subsp. enterica serovar Java]
STGSSCIFIFHLIRLTPGGGTFYLLRLLLTNNCRHVRMPQAGYLARLSSGITLGIVRLLSGLALS